MIQEGNAFSSLLHEASDFAYPEISQLIKDQCLPISTIVAHADPCTKTIVIMLEFHHDKSDRVDVSFLSNRWSNCTQENIVPPWWSRIDESCLDQVESEQDLIHSRTEPSINSGKLDAADIKAAGFHLGKSQFLECELSGRAICAAGIFIPVIREEDSKKPLFKTCLDVIVLIQNAQGQAGKSDINQALKVFEFVEMVIGVPQFIGVMTGRQGRFKLVFGTMPDSGKIKKILQSKYYPEESSVFINRFTSVANAVALIPGVSAARICLDLNPLAGTVDSRLCIEIMPSHPTTETRRWSILEQLEIICHLDSDEVQHIRQTHRHLPIGFKPDPILTMLSTSFGVPQQNSSSECSSCKSAKLSHYKICIEPRKTITIKSYSYLVNAPLD